MTERDVFEAALEQPPENRAAYLDGVCGADAARRQRVEALLSKHDRAGSFLENPAVPALATVDEPITERPGTVIGPYKLLEQIGEGGFGVVFMAEQQEPIRRKVALKILKPGMDSQQVIARFEAERQALAIMDHPNIAKVLDAGQTSSGRPYFVMDLVKGLPITDYCDQSRLAPPERLELFVQVCQAVQHAHQKGIIHRDLKPSNVLVTLHDGTPLAKIIDFGIAKALGQPLTDKSLFTGFAQMIGTPLYMSPEQTALSNVDVDTRSDIYSLGVLLYELLTGTTPFDKERLREASYDDICRIIREEEPPKPSTRMSTVGQAASTASEKRQSDPRKLSRLFRGELDWIVMKALEKDRNRRYETASAFAADVQRYLRDEPVHACPPSALYRLHKFARRNKAALGTAALVALFLALGVLGLAADDVRVSREKEQVLDEKKQKEQALWEETEAKNKETEAKNGLRAALDREWQESYVRRIALAHHECLANRLDRANQLLDECVPREEGQADLRSFEWYYLKRLCRGPLLTVHGDPAFGQRVALSPDGNRLAMTITDNVVSVLDARTGQRVPDCPPLILGSSPSIDLHGELSWQVAFSPDGQCLAAIDEGCVKVWHVATGQEVLSLPAVSRGASTFAFSKDGRRIATARGNGTVTVWDTATGREVRTFGAAAPDGPILPYNVQSVEIVAFSPDGKFLAGAAHWSDTVKLWDTGTGEEALTLRGHTGNIHDVAFSPNGRFLASASGDRTVRVWNVKTGTEQLRLSGHTSVVLCLAFSRDGSQLVSGSSDGTVKVWGAAGREVQILRGHSAAVLNVCFSADGQRLATADASNTVKVWDVRTAPDVRTFAESQLGLLPAEAFSPNGFQLARMVGGAVSVWPRRGPGAEAVGSRLRLGEIRFDEGERAPFIEGNQCPTGSGFWRRVSPDGQRLADHERVYLDPRKPHEVLILDPAPGVQVVAFRADGLRLATMAGQEVKLWDLPSGQLIHTLRGPDLRGRPAEKPFLLNLPSVALSPDGRWLAASGDYVKVWDAVTGRELHTLRGHPRWVPGLAFSPDSRRLATGGIEGSVKLWDVTTGYEVLGFQGQAKPVNSLAFSSDGRHLMAARQLEVPLITPSEVQVWDAEEPIPEVRAAVRESGKVVRPFGGSDKMFWLDDEKVMNQMREELGRTALERPGRLGAALSSARSRAGLGRWKETVAAYAEAVQADPQAAQAAYEHVAALLLAGDRDDCRQAGAQAIKRFTKTANPWAACSVARLALLGRDTGADPAQLLRLAEQAAAAHPESGPRLQTLAAAHYRAGHYDQALRTLQEAEKADWFGYPMAINWLLRALVHQRLDQTDEARTWLKKASAWLDQATQATPKEQAEVLQMDLHDLMACKLLRRQAEALIPTAENPVPPKDTKDIKKN
jgi:eukaryotic-like serine/threonine-protein kinase